METRPLGTSDISITPMIMGTWQARKRGWTGVEDKETIKAIPTAFESLKHSAF